MNESIFNEVNDGVKQVQGWVQKPLNSEHLKEHLKVWNKVNASFDIILHTNIAMKSYFLEEEPSDVGVRLLYLNGLMQSLVQQQDSILLLGKIFKFEWEFTIHHGDWKLPHDLLETRHLRNGVTGHPVSLQGKEKYVYFLNISKISKEAFTVIRQSPQKESIRTYSPLEIIEDQLNRVKDFLFQLDLFLK